MHVEFTEKEDRIKIEGPPEEVEKAQEKIEERARELIATYVFSEILVDPKYYKHIIGKNGANGKIFCLLNLYKIIFEWKKFLLKMIFYKF